MNRSGISTGEWQRLAAENHNLIYAFMHKYHLDEDWYGELAIALCHAACSYDESKGCAFSTLAYKAMFNAMAKQYRDHENREVQSVSENEVVPGTDIEYRDLAAAHEAVGTDAGVISYMEWILEPSRPKDLMIVWQALHGITQQEIAERIGISQVQVSRRLNYLKRCYEDGMQFTIGKKRYDNDERAKLTRDRVIRLMKTI